MRDGKCKWNYPKDYAEQTIYRKDGYPLYRRRRPPPSAAPHPHVNHDNRWVVPYNPFLLGKYQCHLNVEVCTTIHAVKYLYKYVYKGHDRAALDLVRNEIVDFLDARYVGAPEAAWRLFNMPIHGKSHTVERLPVHLPFQQQVCFQRGKR